MLKYFLNLLFPIKCLVCDDYDNQTVVCGKCWSNFTFITKPRCFICSYPFEYEEDEKAICGNCISSTPKYNKAISIFKYNDHIKKLIHKFKYQDQLHVLKYFTELMVNIGKEMIEQTDIIIPVAMHRYKLLKRGYNQSALLAMSVAKREKIKYLPQVLIKIKNNIAQADLKKEQRLKNVKNTFQINPKMVEQIRDKNILIIDDVITTGATIDECCRTLLKAKPKKIFVLTLAKKI